MQEAVAVATETVMKINQAVTNLNAAVSDVRQFVLTADRLSSVGNALTRFDQITIQAEGTVRTLNQIVTSNALPVATVVSNLGDFSAKLSPLADRVNDVVANNEADLHLAMQNLVASTAALTNLLANLENGQGPAGRLLRDETLATNLSEIAQNIAITTSNLNTRGLWGIMWKQKSPPADAKPKTK